MIVNNVDSFPPFISYIHTFLLLLFAFLPFKIEQFVFILVFPANDSEVTYRIYSVLIITHKFTAYFLKFIIFHQNPELTHLPLCPHKSLSTLFLVFLMPFPLLGSNHLLKSGIRVSSYCWVYRRPSLCVLDYCHSYFNAFATLEMPKTSEIECIKVGALEL